MVAPAAVVLIIIVIIAVVLYVTTLALFIATANQLDGADKRNLLAAGAMIGVAIPFIILGAIFGILHFGQLHVGKKNNAYMWLFIIMSSIAAILVFIASTIGWVYGGRLDGAQKRNVQAASALSLVGAALFVVAFIMMLILAKKNITKSRNENILTNMREGKSYDYTYDEKNAVRKGLLRSLKGSRSAEAVSKL